MQGVDYMRMSEVILLAIIVCTSAYLIGEGHKYLELQFKQAFERNTHDY